MKYIMRLALSTVVLAAIPAMTLAEQTTTQQVTRTTQTKTMSQQQQSQMKDMSACQNQGMTTTPTTNSAANQQQIDQQWVSAQTNLINRHYPEASADYQRVLASQPNNVRALHGLATAQYAQGHYTEAAQTIDKALALDPVNPQLFYTKAQILDAQDRPQEAIDSYLTFSAMAPNDTSALMAQRRANELYKREEPRLSESQKNYFQGLHLLSLQQPQQAIPLFEKYQAMEPSNPKANILLGRSYQALGQHDRAIGYYQAAVKQNTSSPVAYYGMGSTYDMKGEPEHANMSYKKFLQFAPQSQSAMLINQRTGTTTQTR